MKPLSKAYSVVSATQPEQPTGYLSPRHAPRGLRLCFRWLWCWTSVRRLEQQKHRGKSPVGEAHSIATAKEIGQCFLLYSTLLRGPVAQLVKQRIEKIHRRYYFSINASCSKKQKRCVLLCVKVRCWLQPFQKSLEKNTMELARLLR